MEKRNELTAKIHFRPPEMRTPKSQTAVTGKHRSVSEQRLHRNRKPPHGKPLPFRLDDVGRSAACFRSRIEKPKSETRVNDNILAPQKHSLDDSAKDPPLIPSPKTPKHPKDVLRISLLKLKSAQRSDSVKALQDIVQISRFDPYLLARSMDAIYKGITVLVRSLRTTVARTACQTANELFMNTPSKDGPEFLDLVHALLQKSSDANKQLRDDALEALDSMVIHVAPSQSVKALLHRRIAGCNLNVRTTASRLLACVLSDSDADSAVSLGDDAKTRLVLAAMRFLQNDSHEIKFHGMRLMTTLMRHKEFEKTFRTNISVDTLNQINAALENVKTTIRHSNTWGEEK